MDDDPIKNEAEALKAYQIWLELTEKIASFYEHFGGKAPEALIKAQAEAEKKWLELQKKYEDSLPTVKDE